MPKVKTARHFTCRRCANPLIEWTFGHRPEAIKITFSTSDELDKHLRTEHKSAMYSCTAVGCFRGTSAPKFQKAETLTQHIKELHNPDTIYTCPINTCNIEPSKLDHIAIHAHWTHTKNPSKIDLRGRQPRNYDAAVSAMINAASWSYFRCPIWNCRRFVSGGHEKVSAHLLEHLPIELESAQDGLAMNGYEIGVAPDTIALSNDPLLTSSVHVQIRCPACGVRSDDDAEFRHHIETSHMLARSPGMREHFETWRADVMSRSLKVLIDRVFRRPCWLDRASYHDRHGRNSVFKSCGVPQKKCSYPTCSFYPSSTNEEHPGFLRPAEEILTGLWPHRAQILRHFPQFISHPMFQERVSSYILATSL
jgi:hypothetical protein